MKPQRWAALAPVILASSMFARDARAGEPVRADQKAAAQALFEQGRELLEQGHPLEACPKFAESQRLDPGIGTMLWLADCHESAGQTASAWATFKEAAGAAALRKDPRAKVAQERAAQLEAKLSHLTILVPPEAAAQGVKVLRDDVVIESAQYGLPVPLDPGVHTIKAEAPRCKPWSTTVELTGGTLPITIPLLEEEPVASASAASQGSEAEPAPNGREAPPSMALGGPQRIAGLSVGAAGLVGIVVGSVFGIRAKSTYDESNTNGHCVDNTCDAMGKKDRADANSMATVATVAIGIGAAAAVGGVVLYFTAPKSGGAPVGVAFAPQNGGGSLQLLTSW